MFDPEMYRDVVYGFLAVAALVFPFLFFVTAPYGRHTRKGWGPQINSTLGWVLMEIPAVIVVGLFFLFGDRSGGIAVFVLYGMWNLHYVNRSLIFPFRRKGGQKPMPLMIALSAVLFNLINGYLQGGWLFGLGPDYDASWLSDPRFIGGALLFLAGFAINQQSDQILFNLRKPGETGYKIPHGGFYRWLSAPNYFGEILEWIGWAIATWSLPGLAFAIWTAANLAPRARSNHQWYLDTFEDYPKDRKALIPFVF